MRNKIFQTAIEIVFVAAFSLFTLWAIGAEVISPSQATRLQKLLKARPKWITEETALNFASGKIISHQDTAVNGVWNLFPIPKAHTETIVTTITVDKEYNWKPSAKQENSSEIIAWDIIWITLGAGIAGFILTMLFWRSDLIGKIVNASIAAMVLVFLTILVLACVSSSEMAANEHIVNQGAIFAYLFLQPCCMVTVIFLFLEGCKLANGFLSVVENELDKKEPSKI